MDRNVSHAESKIFDLVIMGGGITGASIAWEASLRGHKVLLLEKKDFGHGTSSATSKLIHGGLRYLARMELSIVRESLRERRFLEENLGHLCFPMPFLMPVYKKSRTPRWKLKLGLWLYDLLAYDRNELSDPDKYLPGHKWLTPEEVSNMDPNVPQENLKGAFLYYDVLNKFPQRSNLAFVKSAVKEGAIALNHCEVKDLLVTNDGLNKTLHEIEVIDKITGNTFTVKGKGYINAAGPWADLLMNKIDSENSTQIHRSKGIHLILPKQQSNVTITFETKDKKHFFLIPWLDYTILGTTDTPYKGSPDNVDITAEEANDLLSLASQYYPIKDSTIIQSYAGLRPLVVDKKTKKGTYELSRKHEIIDHAKQQNIAGIISVLGGKWTTSRALAEETVNYSEKAFQLSRKSSISITKKLAGSEYQGRLADYYANIMQKDSLLNGKTIEALLELYGTETKTILEMVEENPELSSPIGQIQGIIKAQIHFAVFKESALTLEDLLFRRLNLGNTGEMNAAVIKAIADEQAKCLGWTIDQLNEQLAFFNLQAEKPAVNSH
jgi:glycerol-3-phosphate dehydrogenase